jgi:hypothetical protein
LTRYSSRPGRILLSCKDQDQMWVHHTTALRQQQWNCQNGGRQNGPLATNVAAMESLVSEWRILIHLALKCRNLAGSVHDMVANKRICQNIETASLVCWTIADGVSRIYEKKGVSNQVRLRTVFLQWYTAGAFISRTVVATNKAPIRKCRVGKNLVSSCTHKMTGNHGLQIATATRWSAGSAAVSVLVRLLLNDKIPPGN